MSINELEDDQDEDQDNTLSLNNIGLITSFDPRSMFQSTMTAVIYDYDFYI